MKISHLTAIASTALVCLTIAAATVNAGVTAAIDIDDNDTSGTQVTASGFTSLIGQTGNSVVVDGVTYELFGAMPGTRDRLAPDDLTRDFTFNTGAGTGIGLRVTGLAAGTYNTESWHYDDDFPGTVQIELRKQGESLISGAPLVDSHAFTTAAADYKISIEADTIYEFVFREDDGDNRSRFNGIRLVSDDSHYESTVESDSPLAYYRLNESLAAFGAVDETGNNAAATYVSGVTVNSSDTPTGAGFEGSNTSATFDATDAGSIVTDLATGWSSDAGSISYFFRMDAAGGDATGTGVFARDALGDGEFGGSSDDYIGTFTRKNGSFGINVDGNAVQAAVGTIGTEEWHQLTATWDRAAGLVTLYLDGEIVDHVAGATWTSFDIDEARFGKEITATARQFDGSADELAIFNAELGAERVAAHYQAAINGTTLMAAYTFEELTPGANGVLPSIDVANSDVWSATSIDQSGLGNGADDAVRDANADTLASTALVLSPSSIAGNNPLTASPVSTDDYLAFDLTNDKSGALTLDLLTFDWGLSATGTGGLDGHAQLFVKIGAGAFVAIGPEFSETVASGEFSGMIRREIDLSVLGYIAAGETVEFRLAFADNSGAGTGQKAHYIDNVLVFGEVPTPAALPAGLAMIGLLATRRRR